VIARAGASTCFELCALGKPAILIPLPSAMNDHQTLNAQAMSQCGGALLCPQAELTPEKLASLLKELACDRPRLSRMGRALLELAVPNATGEICQLLECGG
ncbi:MAG: UDP-N-acetylglucosamine--N-acetylmuramyl-(pentapeptide) pyrophosphoryl-undecaprenol N-acetylglucosamine transferase, partial [Kiritimatiellia bacterium]